MTDLEEMTRFLGGDVEAKRIALVLERGVGITTPDELRTDWDHASGYGLTLVDWLGDVQHIGPGRLERIRAALAGEL